MSHVPDVLYRRAQPALGLFAAPLGDGMDGAPAAEARLDRFGRDEPGVQEPTDRPVDDGRGDAPDPADLAIGTSMSPRVALVSHRPDPIRQCYDGS
jgi:hypothetical protein